MNQHRGGVEHGKAVWMGVGMSYCVGWNTELDQKKIKNGHTIPKMPEDIQQRHPWQSPEAYIALNARIQKKIASWSDGVPTGSKLRN